MTCNKCNGTGHDKEGRPVIRRDTYKTAEGTRIRHITMKRGSGCLKCLGTGRDERT